MSRLLGIHARPGKWLRRALAILPFVLLIAVYSIASEIRHRDNPSDKLLPSFTQMGQAVERMAFTEDRRSGKYLMPADTLASLKRLFIGILLAAAVGLLLGLNMGVFPGMDHGANPFVVFLSMIPPLAILPILFIVFGLGELSKTALIVIGVFPTITLDTYLRSSGVPRQQITKGLTLGASDFEVAYKIVLPQIMPGVLDTIRLNFKAVILFLIAGESLAATVGLGYRIFVVRRYLAMDIIIPYVIWMSLLAFTADFLLRWYIERRYHWSAGGAE